MNTQTIAAPQTEIKPIRKREVGFISMGISLIAAGICSGLAIMNLLMPLIVARLLIPGYFAVLGIEILIVYGMDDKNRLTATRVRYGLVVLSFVMIGLISLVLQAFYYSQLHHWEMLF